MLAAEATFGVLHEGSNMEEYWDSLRNSWVWEELHKARNYRPAFAYELFPGLAISELEHICKVLAVNYDNKNKGAYVDGENVNPLTIVSGDFVAQLGEVTSTLPIVGCKFTFPNSIPEARWNFFSFDVPTSLHRSNTNHDHNQPADLRLRDPNIPETVNLPEYVPDEKNQLKLQINAQNCLHCKACDIKDPKQNIEWRVPEGGGGPGYSVM
ncbi:hypothetical protein REPUB_Repub20aG0030200 [Reevesia pubescens]